jgi:hypothetical protein
MAIFKKYGAYFIGIFVGALAGYFYWKYVGCATGTCPITSSPVVSTIYGAIIGGLTGGLFSKTTTKE